MELFRGKRLVLVAGVDNPAATWLFDICRLVVSECGTTNYCCSADQWDATKAGEATLVLLRVSTPQADLANSAWRTYSMHRDLRELALNSSAATNRNSDDPSAFNELDAQVRDHAFWAARSHLALRYEDSLKDPSETLRVIAHSLGETVSLAAEEHLIARLRETRAEFCVTSRRTAEWASGIAGMTEPGRRRQEWMQSVEDGYSWWLKEYGYETADRRSNGIRCPITGLTALPMPAGGQPHVKIPTKRPLPNRRILALYELTDLESSYRAFSHLANLHRQLDGASSVESFLLGNYAGPTLPKGSSVLKQRRFEPHRRSERAKRRLISLIRRKPSVFRWFSNIDSRREAVIELLRRGREPWSDILLFITDAEFGVNLIEYLFLFLRELPQHVIVVLPAATDAPRAALERIRYFGVRVLFDASDYGAPTMRFAGTGMLRSLDDHMENPLHPRKAPLVDWPEELDCSHFQEKRPETILFIHPDWENCGSATTFAKLSRLFRLRGAIQIGFALQPYRIERDINVVNRKLTRMMASPRPALYFEVGRRWPFERLNRLALALRTWTARIRTTTEYVMAFYSQCVTPRWIKGLLHHAHIDYVYLNHYFTFDVAGRIHQGLPLLLDTHDVQSTNFVEHNYPLWLGGPSSSFQANLEKELEIMSRATMLTMVSQDEIDLVLGQRPDLDIFHYIPVPDVQNQREAAHDNFVGPCQIKLLIVASRNPANERSLTWFLRSVWPYVASPALILEIVGAIDGYFVGQTFPQVRFRGMVESLRETYRQADIVLLPVTNGGGIAIKTLEAIQYERPLVATGHAFRGLPADVKADMPLCNDESQMIQDIIQLTTSFDARTTREQLVLTMKHKLAQKNYDGILENRLDDMLKRSPSAFRNAESS